MQKKNCIAGWEGSYLVPTLELNGSYQTTAINQHQNFWIY